MSEKNLEIARRAYELFGKGDLAALKEEVFAADIVWRTAGPAPFAPEYTGVDAVLGYFGQLFERSGGTFRAEPLHIYADEDRTVAIQRVTASRDDKVVDTKMVLVSEVQDGRVVEVTQFAAEASKLEEFWS